MNDRARNDSQTDRRKDNRPAGEPKSFGKQDIPKAHDFTGPAGDPAEGKRPGGSTWPA